MDLPSKPLPSVECQRAVPCILKHQSSLIMAVPAPVKVGLRKVDWKQAVFDPTKIAFADTA